MSFGTMFLKCLYDFFQCPIEENKYFYGLFHNRFT